ncbi:putative ubiquitinyl hydrolase 1 [Helianthus anomalus]
MFFNSSSTTIVCYCLCSFGLQLRSLGLHQEKKSCLSHILSLLPLKDLSQWKSKISLWWLIYVLLCWEVVLVKRVLIFPKGNNVDHLSMYLDVVVSTIFQFSLAVVNQICSNFTI